MLHDRVAAAGACFGESAGWERPNWYARNKDGGFVGRDRLFEQRESGLLPRRLVQFLLSDPEPLLYHNEPIYRDGVRVGFVSSAMYGHTLGGAVGLGYLEHAEGCSEEFIRSGRYEIQLPERRVAAQASLSPLYDPKSLRIHAESKGLIRPSRWDQLPQDAIGLRPCDDPICVHLMVIGFSVRRMSQDIGVGRHMLMPNGDWEIRVTAPRRASRRTGNEGRLQ